MRNTVILVALLTSSALADQRTIGPKGIDSKATGLDGDRIEIGQIEGGRSAKPNYGTPPEPSASNTKPEAVYFRIMDALPDESEEEHATIVAEVMIGDDSAGVEFEGVAPKANLHSAALGLSSGDELDESLDDVFGLTADRLARISGPDPNAPGQTRRMRAINLSAYRPLNGIPPNNNDGNSHMTLFVDWSARRHDVLYVFGWGNDDSAPKRAPTDNFNGMTVAASQQVDPDNGDDEYRRFGSINSAAGQPADFPRNAISLLAPGQPVALLKHGDVVQGFQGTSLAAPHVTGTVALLQQYAEPKVDAGTDPKWTENSHRLEVMKAVMMNAADKLDGVHGSTRDVQDINGNDWTMSPANQPQIPTDPWMGTGHLNARRSLLQYESGETDPGTVPSIAWDYHGVGDRTEYVFDSEIGGGYIAATLAWDRRVDKATPGNYMEGDQFVFQTPEQRLNNLDLYLMPANSNDLEAAIAKSISTVQSVEHIFFDIPSPGQYKLVVHNNPVGGINDFQNYALAWWFGNPAAPAPGDYDGNGTVGPEDYDTWKSTFGNSITAGSGADGNGNGMIDAADYVVWRDAFTAGSGSLAAVPEPAAAWLAIVGLICGLNRMRSLPSTKRI